jgi:F0F1-type ATP synthase assembly protein I
MIKNFLDADEEQIEPKTTAADSSIFGGLSAEPVVKPKAYDYHDPFAASDFQIDPTPHVEPQPTKPVNLSESPHYTPPTAAESSRMSGLAFTAGVAFFSSVVFMLVLGWLVDTFIGTAPWGIVGGIVLGSIIGFIQFFRLNSQILKNSNTSQPTSFLDLAEIKSVGEVQAQTPVGEPDRKEPENTTTAL